MLKRCKRDFLLCFLVISSLSVMIWLIFQIKGKSFIYWGDAVPQHFPAAVYWSQYLKKCISNLKAGNSLPLWDFSIGFGDDILTTMNYYVGGDILSFAYLAADTVFDVENIYGFLVLIRFCAAGLSMFCYLHFKEKSVIAGICGAVIYAFSFWSLTASSWHPFFTNTLIYLPWLFICIELIFAENRHRGGGASTSFCYMSASGQQPLFFIYKFNCDFYLCKFTLFERI